MIYVLIYLASYVGAYLLLRKAVRDVFFEWTVGDRIAALFASLCGPIAIFTALLLLFVESDFNDRNANW